VCYEGFRPLYDLESALDKTFDNLLRGFSVEPFGKKFGEFVPKVDVTETEKALTVTAELPGLDEKDVEVSVSKDNILTLKGQKKVEKEDKEGDYYHLERSYGSFYRSIGLPKAVDTDKITAEFKKGILTVTLPKTAEAIIDPTFRTPISKKNKLK
jgi:HSP20 family protein